MLLVVCLLLLVSVCGFSAAEEDGEDEEVGEEEEDGEDGEDVDLGVVDGFADGFVEDDRSLS